jgi:formylglycine-generating enzyme required for sulfatase activity
MNMRISIALTLLLTGCNVLRGQSVTNVSARQEGQEIVLSYQLSTSEPCSISLYVSKNLGETWEGPLVNCSGDLGEGITSGSKLIRWSVMKEQDEFIGDRIQFKVVLGGVWTDEFKELLEETCLSLMELTYEEADSKAICDCYINNLSRKYPNLSFTDEDNYSELEACSSNYYTAAEKNEQAREWNLRSIEPEMVFVQGGRFMMGSNSGEDDEKPVHEVELSSYYIGKYEITQAQWKAVMGINPSKFSGCDQCPVERVSWNDIQAFIRKLNQLTGKSYRLPTEAEWEYAAKGGLKSRGFTYSGGNDIESVGWYSNNSGSKTHPVGQKAANELGIYDMTGNVLEWSSDWYGSFASTFQRNPVGPTSGQYRVLRGGSWNLSPKRYRASYRFTFSPDNRNDFIGFRLVLSPVQ